MGHSAVAGRMDKHLSFLTFLKDTDQIEFQQYNGYPPAKWKDDDLYFLRACQRVRTCTRYCNVCIIVASDLILMCSSTSNTVILY